MLAQYIYITNFLYSNNPEVKMVEFLETLHQLAASEIDFRIKLVPKRTIEPKNEFVRVLSEYYISVMNVDFEWHAFFMILTCLETGNVYEDILRFTSVIHTLLIQPQWYSGRFAFWDREDAVKARQFYEKAFAKALAESDNIHMIHETYLLKLMNWFWAMISNAEESFSCYDDIEAAAEQIEAMFVRNVKGILKNER